jgi:AmmeMemoRadiSam system protein A
MQSLAEVGRELPAVARAAIAAELAGTQLVLPAQSLPPAPVFVTLRTQGGDLRGCIGTISAVETDVVRETARNAVLSATRDPRFDRVTAPELADLTLEVSVLMPEQPVDDESQLDAKRYGVIVRDASGRRGVLLPDIPGVDTVAEQVRITRRKAGIPEDAPIRLSRFEVLKFEE